MLLFVTYILALFVVFYYNISIECLALITLIMAIIVTLLNYINKKLDDVENNKKEGE
jgi:uncharacterized membrane protein (DUF106 family)